MKWSSPLLSLFPEHNISSSSMKDEIWFSPETLQHCTETFLAPKLSGPLLRKAAFRSSKENRNCSKKGWIKLKGPPKNGMRCYAVSTVIGHFEVLEWELRVLTFSVWRCRHVESNGKDEVSIRMPETINAIPHISLSASALLWPRRGVWFSEGFIYIWPLCLLRDRVWVLKYLFNLENVAASIA